MPDSVPQTLWLGFIVAFFAFLIWWKQWRWNGCRHEIPELSRE